MRQLNLVSVWEREFVTIRYSAKENLVWNEWRGFIPSKPLREAMVYASEYVVAHDVAYILADFTRFGSPSLEDQIWIANHTAEILRYSKLKRVANILAPDIFQQMAIETIYNTASKIPMPCVTKDFVSREDALEWLFEE